jgi:dihydrofolate synthase/folylpolyglutamate synthase
MIGAIQAENMALALLSAATVESRLNAEQAASGMAKAFLPARFQLLSLDPPLVIDGAHTPNSVRLALASFETLFPGPKALLFACAEDKKHTEMAAILAPHFDRITLTRPGSFKKGDLVALADSFRAAAAPFRQTEDHVAAILQARGEAASLGLPLLVTGSFYLCSEFARLIQA